MNAGPLLDMGQEVGPAKMPEEVPKVRGQLTKVPTDWQLLIWVMGSDGDWWPWALCLWRAVATMSRRCGLGVGGGGASAIHHHGDKSGKNGLVGRGGWDVCFPPGAVFVAGAPQVVTKANLKLLVADCPLGGMGAKVLDELARALKSLFPFLDHGPVEDLGPSPACI